MSGEGMILAEKDILKIYLNTEVLQLIFSDMSIKIFFR